MKKKQEVSIRSGAAEYLTYVASTGGNSESFDILYQDENICILRRVLGCMSEDSFCVVDRLW